jgi:putative hydrolase
MAGARSDGTDLARRRIDFHAHTYLSDGRFSATAMWSEALRTGHRALAITEHIALEDPTPILERLRAEARAFEDSEIVPLVGVELTMLPPRRIDEAARAARRAGAEIVIVHGETLAESVPEGTNRAAIVSGQVDVLAHPGFLTEEEAELARDNGTVLELSGRRAHMVTNGHVARIALAARAEVVVDSDAHAIEELLTYARAESVARGAGLIPADAVRTVGEWPQKLLARCGGR